MLTLSQLSLLKALALWSLNQSEILQTLIKESYKQTRKDDDRNQPRSVQPWFSDQYRRKYWLVEGLEDSHFRIYRENDGKTAKTNTWFSVAGSIPELVVLADKFGDEHTQNSKVNSDKLRSAVPRFEAGDEVWVVTLRLALEIPTNCFTETETARLSSGPQGRIHSSRTRVFSLRRSNAGQENEVYLLRR